MGRPTIRTYQDADRFLGRASSLSTGQRGTRVKRESDTVITVWYHDTPAVTYYKPGTNSRVATIDTAGWKTPTTMARINEYAPEGVEVYAAGEDEDGYPEMLLLSDEKNGVRDHLLDQPYHMANPRRAR